MGLKISKETDQKNNAGNKNVDHRKLPRYMKMAIGVVLICAVIIVLLMTLTDKNSANGIASINAFDAQENDPHTYTSRDWANDIELPSEEQIAAANGKGRSPYIAFYMHFPGVDRAEAYCVDMHVDHQPNGTYACPIDWYTDVSSLEQQYVSVFNDYSGVPGGYCGFQILGDGSKVFIMTVWDIFCKDKEGNETVYVPEVVYPKGQGKVFKNDAEGSFVQYIVPYDWKPGRDYRVLLQQSNSEDTGNVVFTTWVCDLAENSWTKMASFDTGVANIYLGSFDGFLENFYEEFSGNVRTMELSNLKVKAAGSKKWIAADSVTFIEDTSIGIDEYVGSANYGTDGASLWIITSGVEGIGRTLMDEEQYGLEAGDLSEVSPG
jgi:hypothetical protein